ncbi:MAG TPA: hypothetical protein VMD05_07415 [Candidatus Nanoarchaeia archaeon]|nr:hypothetical protein [Candidatus Nanoarchaeia archaeon]
MVKKRVYLSAVACIVILIASIAGYSQFIQQPKKSWLHLDDFVVYQQDFAWAGGNSTGYMFWNITSLNGDMANIRLLGLGIEISNGSVDIAKTEVNYQVNITTRQIINCLAQSAEIGKKFPLWIPQSVQVGDAVQTSYGESFISPSQTLGIMGQNRSCWLVAYAYRNGNMDRYYDTSTGICLLIRTHIFSDGILVAINETAVQTNIKSI